MRSSGILTSSCLWVLIGLNECALASGHRGDSQQQVPLSSGSSGKARNPFTEEFAAFVKKEMGDWKAAGAAIAVVDGDDTFYEGFGYATLPDTPATPETLWYAGSTTKAFTASTLSLLIHANDRPELALGWQTPINTLIRDDFVLQDEWATAHLTLEDLVSHRTGQTDNIIAMPRIITETAQDKNGKMVEVERNATMRDLVRNLRNFPMYTEPRTVFQYNNEMYATLSHVVETLTGEWIGDTFKEKFWKPLGMNATYLDLDEALRGPEHVARGYRWSERDEKFVKLPFLPTGPVGGVGAVISNVVDYTKWIKCLLRKGSPLPEAVHDDLRTPRFINSAVPQDGFDVSMYSLGWFRTTFHGRVLYWHSGSTATHGALVYWLPDEDYGVVILMNHSNFSRFSIMRKLIEDKLGVPEEERIDINKVNRETLAAIRRQLKDVDNILYPDRPQPAEPPTVPVSDLAGKYHAPGFGTYHFQASSSSSASFSLSPSQKGEEELLKAKRPDGIWKVEWTLRHVSADFWTATVAMGDDPDMAVMAIKAEFRKAVDGKTMDLVLTFPDRQKVNGGEVYFVRQE